MATENLREVLKNKKRIVVKIGSSSLTHKETNSIDLYKLEKLVRVLTDLRNQGKDVILVSSGAIAVGRKSETSPLSVIFFIVESANCSKLYCCSTIIISRRCEINNGISSFE